MNPSRSMVWLVALVLAACSGGGGGDQISLVPSAKEQANLDAHVEQIFTGVVADDESMLEADRERVRGVHQIAYLIEQYYKQTGTYPMVDPVEGKMCNVLIGNPHVAYPHDSQYYASEDSFLTVLRDVLGYDVELPGFAMADLRGYYSFAYGAYGRGYGIAAMLRNPVGWSEGIQPEMFQYRLGSSESLELPMLKTSKLLEGGYPENRKAKWRDPSMADR